MSWTMMGQGDWARMHQSILFIPGISHWTMSGTWQTSDYDPSMRRAWITNCKRSEIKHICSPAILCLQETWGKNSLTDYSIRVYHPPVILTRQGYSMNLGGGVAICVINSVEFTTLKTVFQEKTIKTVGITIQSVSYTHLTLPTKA